VRVDCLKGKEFKNERISNDKRIIINKDISIGIHDIPYLHKLDGHVHYTQIGMTIYIVYVNDTEGIMYMYMIEQGIENNALKIENIYTTTIVAEKNTLARFFRYDEEFEKETLTTRLNEIIRVLPVIPEKDYLQRKITEYLEKEEVQVKPTLVYENLEKGKQGHKKEIVCYGKTYETIAKFSKEFKIPYGTVTRNLYEGMTPEEIVEKTKRKDEDRTPVNAKKIICYGEEYKSMAKFCEAFKIPMTTFQFHFKRGLTPEEIVEMRKKSHGKLKVDPATKWQRNMKYNYAGEEMTLDQLAEISDVPRKVIWDRIRRQGWSVEDAVEKPMKIQGGNVNE
jgi:hypothetical protein